jgi:hypothetical protein
MVISDGHWSHELPRVFAWVVSVVNGVHLRLAEMLCYDSKERLLGKANYVNNLLFYVRKRLITENLKMR